MKNWVHSFNGKIFDSKSKVAGSSPAGPAFGTPKRTYGVAQPASRYAKETKIRFMFYVYSLKCKNGYYVGCTDNLIDRLDRHKKGHVPATADRLSVSLDFYRSAKFEYPDGSAAGMRTRGVYLHGRRPFLFRKNSPVFCA